MNTPAPTPRLWEWPTILSLDAPLVAVLWQGLLAHALGVRLEPHHVLLLAAPVWLVYVADRWLDAWRLDPRRPQTLRHRFHFEWRWPLAALWLLVLLATAVTAGRQLRTAELELGFAVLAAALVYLALVHLPFAPSLPPKELQVALLFAAGVGLFLAAPAGAALVLPLALFALLCFVNAALIARWEGPLDRAQDQASVVTSHPWLSRRLEPLLWLLMLLPLALWPLWPGLRLVWLSLAGSAVALYALERHAAHFEADLLRVLADAALLSPAPLLVAAWLGG